MPIMNPAHTETCLPPNWHHVPDVAEQGLFLLDLARTLKLVFTFK